MVWLSLELFSFSVCISLVLVERSDEPQSRQSKVGTLTESHDTSTAGNLIVSLEDIVLYRQIYEVIRRFCCVHNEYTNLLRLSNNCILK